MGLHKLTAGDGYTYLTRQVAAYDSTDKGHTSLGDYYEQKGETPGEWLGSGLAGLSMEAGESVHIAQMNALFGEGRHPNARELEDAVIEAGGTTRDALAASALGRAFAVFAGANSFQKAVAREFTAYNIERGSKWDTAIADDVRSKLRTDLGARMFTEAFGRAPADSRELSGFIARASRQSTTAVAGYDLTFSPVKSVSALWAVAPRAVAEQIQEAHRAAVASTLSWLETEATFTRTGRNGVRQVEVNGLIAAAFTHRDTRAGDPDLHTHVAVSNKVQTRDGRWLAVDGRVLYKANVSASERYNTRLEAELVGRLGVRFAERPGPDAGKRAVREIVGVDPRLNEAWSKRRAKIETRRATLAVQFQADHGRPPTEVEAIALAQRAALETRAPKHELRSAGEQRATWHGEAVNVCGSAASVARMVTQATGHGQAHAQPITDEFVEQTATRVIGVVQASRATWQVWHVRAEAERQARATGVSLNDVDSAVEAVVRHSLGPGSSIPLGVDDPIADPALLRRADGSSVYLVAGSKRYTSRAVVDAERTLIAAARRHDGRTISATRIGLALAESAANGLELNPAQAQMVRELAMSGARVQVAIAPAGSGKTTAMRVLARAWSDSGGEVIGLAPSARAAAELRTSIETRSDTLAKLTWSLSSGAPPRWVRDIGPQTLVIIDEAGMAGTADLAQAVTYITGKGGSVRLVGDDQQLASIAAGGVLRDIAEQVGVVTLSELQRFTDPAEGAATLALRLGDTAGLGFYLDNGRVHVGDATTTADLAYEAWSADRAAGLDAVMLAPTRDLVAALNARARTDRLSATSAPAGEVALADGNRASAGDVVVTRMNNRELAISGSDWVKNGDRWRVEQVAPGGAVVAVHLDTNRKLSLPAVYVRDHVELGYASTIHGAQGITADACHTVASGEENRQMFYVAMTRGRQSNHVYLVTASDGDEHNIIKPDALLPPTATDILVGILEQDEAQRSAASIARELADPTLLLHDAASRYNDALGFAAQQVVGADTLAAVDMAAARLRPGLTSAPAYPTMRAHLALLAVDGSDPIALLTDVAGPDARELDTARDAAAVIDWRLNPGSGRGSERGPLPWLAGVPDALASNPQWGDYLTARAARVAELALELGAQSAEWTPTNAPAWAARLLEEQHEQLRKDLAVWRAANGIATHDRRPTGGPQLAAVAVRYQAQLDERATAVLGDRTAAALAWAPLVNRVDPRIARDAFWPELADRLSAIDRAGIDVRGMLKAVAATGPLPDDQPAAALWWRLSRHLTPAAVAATQGDGASTLRPAWTPVLSAQLGPDRAERVFADPAWPALVAAVNAAPRDEWTPESLISAAIDLAVASRTTTGEHVADADLAPALVWRVAMLTDPAPLDYEDAPYEDPPVDPYEANLIAPDDLDRFGAVFYDTADAAAASYDVEPPYDPDYDVPRAVDPAHPTRTSIGPPAITPVTVGASPAMQLEYAKLAAETLRGPLEPTEAELWAPNDDEIKWHEAAIGKSRLLELNEQAAAFFERCYPRSWAPDYLRARLGSDLLDDSRFSPGYARASWTDLTKHLQRLGASDEEILAAGLGRLAKTGRVIDQFRDRLMFPIYNGDEIHGFIGRRNPAHDDDSAISAGPKYLNTGRTDLFDKGGQLFGLHEGRQALAAGASPVLVEGPIDAYAITFGSGGTDVGVASLGTAFTDRQANLLTPYLSANRSGVLVATDADEAGQKAAQRAYWQLAARGGNPGHVVMAAGHDPATILELGGPRSLQQLLADAQPLARTLIDARIDAHADELHTPEGHLRAARSAAEVIGAMPPAHWVDEIEHVNTRLHAAPGAVHLAVIDCGSAWTRDPRTQSQQRINAIRDTAQPTSEQTTAAAQRAAADRWAPLARSLAAELTEAAARPLFASTLQRADDAGYDVAARLPALVAEQPLPERNCAAELDHRVISDCPSAAPTTSGESDTAASIDVDSAARKRLDDGARAATAGTTADSTGVDFTRPEDRWRDVADRVDARLTADEGWPALAHTLDRAAAAGVDVAEVLPRLVDASPLPERLAAREVHYRVLAAADIDITPTATNAVSPARHPQESPASDRGRTPPPRTPRR